MLPTLKLPTSPAESVKGGRKSCKGTCLSVPNQPMKTDGGANHAATRSLERVAPNSPMGRARSTTDVKFEKPRHAEACCPNVPSSSGQARGVMQCKSPRRHAEASFRNDACYFFIRARPVTSRGATNHDGMRKQASATTRGRCACAQLALRPPRALLQRCSCDTALGAPPGDASSKVGCHVREDNKCMLPCDALLSLRAS